MNEDRVLAEDGDCFFDVCRKSNLLIKGRRNDHTGTLAGPLVAANVQAIWTQGYGHIFQRLSDLKCETTANGRLPIFKRYRWIAPAISILSIRQFCAGILGKCDGGTQDWSDVLVTPPYMRPCHVCGRFFYLFDVRRTTCNGCRAKVERNKKRQQRGTDLSPRPCAHCGATFTPKRSTAQFCSTACRVAAHRASRAAR